MVYVQLIVSNGATPLVDAIAYTLADEGGMYLHVIYSMPSYIVTVVIMPVTWSPGLSSSSQKLHFFFL